MRMSRFFAAAASSVPVRTGRIGALVQVHPVPVVPNQLGLCRRTALCGLGSIQQTPSALANSEQVRRTLIQPTLIN
jgi:hypothetical protein